MIDKLRSENRFLSSEIRTLANMQYQDSLHGAELEARIEELKRDYVYTLQSAVTIPTVEVMDGFSVKLYGGDVHIERITTLLEEARESNPSLPTCESLLNEAVHIDGYGFRHEHSTTGLALHYAARQLVTHYRRQLASYEQHQRAWTALLQQSPQHQPLYKTKELKRLCRRGVPEQFRGEVWRRLVQAQVCDVMTERGQHYYTHLVNSLHESAHVGPYRKQISLDLLRTMPNNVHFSHLDAEGTQQLRHVLEAVCLHNPAIGYCQGMNFIAAVCLLIMEPQDAFWTLTAINEKYFGPHYFDQNLIGAQADQEVLKDIVMESLPLLYKHLQKLDIDISTVTLNWFLTLFFDAVPFETLLRIWDCLLLEGPKVLFRVAVAVLRLNEPGLLQKKDTISIMKHLKCAARLAFDADALIQKAFTELKQFPRRNDLSAKQVVYLNALKEKMRRRIVYKRSITEIELGITDNPSQTQKAIFQCCIACDEGIVWIVSGTHKLSHVYELDCHSTRLSQPVHTVESRVMCGCCVEGSLFVLGTLSWHLHAYNRTTRQELWCLRLQESVMSLTYFPTSVRTRLFCGMANGTIAVLEFKKDKEPMDHPLYLPISHHAVTSLLLVSDAEIWAGCGTGVFIINAQTLDTLCRLSVSTSHLGYVSQLYTACGDEVWLSVRGSSCIQLWNTRERSCMLKTNLGRKHSNPNIKRDSQTTINSERVTALLPFEDCVWVCNAEGYLSMYQIQDIDPLHSKPKTKLQETPPGFAEPTSMMERVNQLYYARLFQNRLLNQSDQDNHLEEEQVTAAAYQSSSSKSPVKPARKKGAFVKQAAILEAVEPKPNEIPAEKPYEDIKNTANGQANTASDKKKSVANGPQSQPTMDTLDGREFPIAPQNTPDVFGTPGFLFTNDDITLRRTDKSLCDVTSSKEDIHVEHVISGRDITDSGEEDIMIRERSGRYGRHPLTREASHEDVVELVLQARIKIADHPVRALTYTWLEHGPVIVSCAGCHGDREDILRWTQLPDEDLWTNDVVEETQATSVEPEVPAYKKLLRRISTSSSIKQLMGSS